jgi:prevent-host-death family protein
MVTKADTIPAGQFKARCLAILDDVKKNRRSIVVTKRGKPVARVIPCEPEQEAPSLEGSVLHEEDLVAPMLDVWFPRS